MCSWQSCDLKWNNPKEFLVMKTFLSPKRSMSYCPVVTVLTMAFDNLPLIQGMHSSSVNTASASNSQGSSVVLTVLNSYAFPEQNSERDRGVIDLYLLHGCLYTHYNTQAFILVACDFRFLIQGFGCARYLITQNIC